MTIRELIISAGFEVNANSEKKVEKTVNGLKSMATKALGAIGIGFSIAGLSNLAQTAADAQATISQFKQVFDGVEREATDSLAKISKETGVVGNRMKGSYTQIAAFAKTTGMDTKDALGLTNRAMVAVADSAAFYDRTLEETTESLRSFLKGNFENDAALGLSCTETTRNAAANALYGKSFKDLSEQQKQLTLLKMVEDANKLSGALGQSARETDTWTNQLGNMKQSLTDLKAALGSKFLQPAVVALKVISGLLQKATAKINSMAGITEEKTNVMNRKLKEIGNFFEIVGDKINKVANFFGGWGNVLKILTAAITTFIIASKWEKITEALKGFDTALKGVNVKILAIVAIAVILTAIIDDFINFMQGNDSVIGELFGKAGIDADEARQKILNAWNMVKNGLVAAWNFLKSVGMNIFNGLKQFWSQNGEQIKSTLVNVWQTIVTVAKTVFGILLTIVKSIFEAAKAFWNRWGSTIIQYFSDFWNMLTSLVQPFLTMLNGLLNFIKGVFSGNWSQAWEGIKQMFSGFVDFIKNLGSGIITMLVNLGSNIFGPMLEKIKTGFENVKAWFLGLPDMAKQWMVDFVNGLINGIKEKISGFVNTVKGIGDMIASYLHFSEPDEGSLVGFGKWMPDFMTGLAKGIKDNIPLIEQAVKGVSDVLANMGSATINGKTALNAIGGNSKTNNVNQTNEYNIHVTGTDPQTVNKAANTLRDAGGDNTDALANALAYGI